MKTTLEFESEAKCVHLSVSIEDFVYTWVWVWLWLLELESVVECECGYEYKCWSLRVYLSVWLLEVEIVVEDEWWNWSVHMYNMYWTFYIYMWCFIDCSIFCVLVESRSDITWTHDKTLNSLL